MRISGNWWCQDTIKKLKHATETLKQPFFLVFSSSGSCASDHTTPHQIFLVLDHQFLMLPFSLLKAIVILSLSFFAFRVEYSSCLCSVYVLLQLMVGPSLKRDASAGLKPTPSALDMFKKLKALRQILAKILFFLQDIWDNQWGPIALTRRGPDLPDLTISIFLFIALFCLTLCVQIRHHLF